jgi:hypothetical protein
MNRNITVILFFVILGGGVFAFYSYIKKYSPKYKWTENYKKENDQPYGLKVFYELLENNGNKIHTIKNNFHENLDTAALNSNYIVFGNYLYMDSIRANHILTFAEKGNTVLVVSNSAPLEITRMLVPVTDTIYNYGYYLDSVVTVSYNAPTEKEPSFHYQYLKDTSQYGWSAYGLSYFNDTLVNYGLHPFSYLNGRINCYYFNIGKGKVIIHSNPILFSNYNLIKKNGFVATNKILALLNNGNIYWDELSQKPINSFNKNGMPTGNPLQFLFSHKTLRWGWYLFLLTVLLYLLFRSKREQRIIPILPKNTNSSIEYTKAIGVLYFQKGQHKLIAIEMYILFLADLRSKYNILNTEEDSELINQISAKSGIEKEIISKLIKYFRKVRYSPIANSKDLINLHNAVEYYYKNHK